MLDLSWQNFGVYEFCFFLTLVAMQFLAISVFLNIHMLDQEIDLPPPPTNSVQLKRARMLHIRTTPTIDGLSEILII